MLLSLFLKNKTKSTAVPPHLETPLHSTKGWKAFSSFCVQAKESYNGVKPWSCLSLARQTLAWPLTSIPWPPCTRLKAVRTLKVSPQGNQRGPKRGPRGTPLYWPGAGQDFGSQVLPSDQFCSRAIAHNSSSRTPGLGLSLPHHWLSGFGSLCRQWRRQIYARLYTWTLGRLVPL